MVSALHVDDGGAMYYGVEVHGEKLNFKAGVSVLTSSEVVSKIISWYLGVNINRRASNHIVLV